MGQMWIKSDDDWVTASPSARNSSGWMPGQVLWRKVNNTTWNNGVVWQHDDNPPTTPAAPVMTYNATSKVMDIKVTAPADSDIVRGVLKWSRSAYASSPSTTDEGYYDLSHSMHQADSQSFSDFTLNPNEVKHKVTGPSGVAGQTQYVTFWVQDAGYNWSSRAIASYKIPTPPVVTPTVVSKSANFSPSDSCSWNGQTYYWRTDNNYVYQGGLNWHGFWFYGTQISSALKPAKKITKMTIKITRANTVHGVTGEAQVLLSAHKLATQIAGAPNSYDTDGIHIGTLGRGETGTFNVPSAWWPYFISGAYKGLGLYYQSTPFTDVRYLYAYGNAVVHVEWQQ